MKGYLYRKALQLIATGKIWALYLFALSGLLMSMSALALTPQTITFGALADVNIVDGNVTLVATSPAGGVTFATTTPTICSVSANTVYSLGGGICSITASDAGNATYAPAADVVQTFTFIKIVQSITFGALSDKAFGDATFSISATAPVSSATLYASTTSAVCTVTGSGTNGQVTIVSVGTCSIDASNPGNNFFQPASVVTQSFTVNKGAQTITFPVLAHLFFSDGIISAEATISSSLPITYTSGNLLSCTISGNVITMLSTQRGRCQITASQAGDSNYFAATDAFREFDILAGSQTITFGALSAK
ncbi:MAG: hypothetical protein HRT35_02200, partial [Algicola sp.]|nr:hypothetical protein [Algicola sp.]